MKRELTAEQKAKREERVKQFRAMWKQVADMPELERVQLANKVGIVTVEGRALSPRNQCLCAIQNPAVTVVGGFRQWLKQGRAVRKGEHGMMIWVPSIQSSNGNGANGEDAPTTEADETRFFIGTVFDIGQTQEVEVAS
jgi:hypothetical protein